MITLFYFVFKIVFVLVFLFGQGKAGLSVANVDSELIGPLV